MSVYSLLLPVLLPTALALFSFLLPSRVKWVREVVSVAGAIALFVIAFLFFRQPEVAHSLSWAGMGMDFELRLYHFSQFILLALSGFVLLITVYSTGKMAGHPRVREFYGYLFLTAALSAGAVLANNFILLIFFWEGSLLTLYALITVGGPNAQRTAVKALIISGFCDFALILGVAILWTQTGTLTMSSVSLAPHGMAAVAFFLMMVGAIGKAGAMPFHTWIPDAAIDAPVTVMAFIPAALEKLLGIYLLARIALDFFQLKVNDPFSITLMIIGAVTIVLAVFMALIQKDFKRLLSYHAVSQVGYMILGIGTALPIGIAGGIFHMVNHAMYKCGLFLSAGSVEKQAGTTDLRKLGGLAKQMPLTALGFIVCAAAISGVPPLNGFVSKEMIFHGAWEVGWPFAVAAWLGAVLTFASFLKAGHSVFFGKPANGLTKVKESPVTMWLPLLTLAGLCIFFGLGNAVPLHKFIQPIVKTDLHTGLSVSVNIFTMIAGISMFCLLLALGLHIFGYRRNDRKPYLASEPIHKLPGIHTIYNWAEARYFDAYEQGIKVIQGLAVVLFRFVDRPIDWIYETGVTGLGRGAVRVLKRVHTGLYANYLAWVLAGLIIIMWALSSMI